MRSVGINAGGNFFNTEGIMLITKLSDSQITGYVTCRSFKVMFHDGVIIKICQDLDTDLGDDLNSRNYDVDLLHLYLTDLIMNNANSMNDTDYENLYVQLPKTR